MEIPEIILSQSLTKSKSSSIHIGLEGLLKRLDSKALDEILNGEKNEEIRPIDIEIWSIVNTSIQEKKIDEIAQIIFSANEYLRNGIYKGDVKSILIFLSVNCYLQIGLEKLLSNSELESHNTKPLSEKIIQILKSITLSPYALPNAPYWEKEIMNKSEKGFLENDIFNTYNFIESLERDGRGFHFNFLLENLLSFLFHLNYSSFLDALLHLQKPIDFVFYFQSFKKEDLLKVANESTLSNKWLNFELIRQIIEKEDKEKIDESEVEIVKNVLNRIKINDFSFLRQTAIYFHRSSLFNASLGVFLNSANDVQTEEIVSDFSIDKYTFNKNSRENLLNYFAKSASEEQFDLLLKLIFDKWKLWFDSILTTEDYYQNSILLTDFAHYVVKYHIRKTDDNDLVSLMKSLMEKIKFIDSEWATSRSEQLTKFYLYHSQLYLLTYAYKSKKLNTSQMLTNYESISDDKIQLLRYGSDQTERYFKIGKENIDWAKDK